MTKTGTRGRVRQSPVVTVLRAIRESRGFKQLQMATTIKVSQQTYSKYESGAVMPDAERAARLAILLSTTVAELWPGERPSRARMARATSRRKRVAQAMAS